MSRNLDKQVVIITGATSGIGQAVAHQLAQEGCKLVLAARRQDRLRALAQKLEEQWGTEVLVQVTDMSQPQAIEALMAATLEAFGRIDILFSNAGYGDFQAFSENQPQQVVDMFQVNVFGMMYLSQLVAIQQLNQGGPGQIHLVGSIAGKIPTAMTSAYAASKAAIIAYADALRLELYETPIQVSTINPGPVKTAFFDRSPQMLAYAQVVEAFSLEADELASRIVANMKRKHVKRELNLPWQLAFASKLYGLFPQAGDFLAACLFNLKEE